MRAQRFPLHVPVLFRPVGDDRWREATSENISASGVLLAGDHPLDVKTRVEFRLALVPACVQTETTPSCEVSGLGHVVRRVEISGPPNSGLVIAIERYEIVREEDAVFVTRPKRTGSSVAPIATDIRRVTE
jgi:hypothetical protein